MFNKLHPLRSTPTTHPPHTTSSTPPHNPLLMPPPVPQFQLPSYNFHTRTPTQFDEIEVTWTDSVDIQNLTTVGNKYPNLI